MPAPVVRVPAFVVRCTAIALAALCPISCAPRGPVSADVRVDPSVRFQTMQGWEVAVLASVLDYAAPLPAFEPMFEQAAGDLGITRLRLEISAGAEHPPGYGQQYIDRRIGENDLFGRFAYDIINDNDDPNVANLDGFEFTLLDWDMDHLVLPYRRALAARGLTLYTYIQYIDFGISAFEHHDHPAEYGEFMLVVFDHLKAKYGFVPDGISVMNEPDGTPWTGVKLARAVVAAGDRLAAAGYTPDFIAPSTVDRGKAVPLFREMDAVGTASHYLTELSYHCYRDSGRDTRRTIGEYAARRGVPTLMNECWGRMNDYKALHADLELARTSAWQLGPFTGGDGYYLVDPKASPQVTLTPRAKLIRQYLHYIKPGARRVGASTTDPAMDPLAFVGPDGQWVIVVKADVQGRVTMSGLPAGTYGITYTTAAEFDVKLEDVTIAAGGQLSAAIPDAGVLTVFGK
jgi:hypothetical protein